jgi:hypothetical protein
MPISWTTQIRKTTVARRRHGKPTVVVSDGSPHVTCSARPIRDPNTFRHSYSTPTGAVAPDVYFIGKKLLAQEEAALI